MKPYILILLVASMFLVSCIMPHKYNQLSENYRNSDLTITALKKTVDSFSTSLTAEKDARIKLVQDTIRLNGAYRNMVSKYRSNLSGGSADATRLMRQLDDNRRILTEYRKRIDDYEKEYSSKELDLRDFRTLVNNFLMSIPSEGIRMSVESGNIVLSIDDALLFEPGGYMLTVESADLLASLSNFFANNPDVKVLVVGNTAPEDSKTAETSISDDLDLSTKRAAEIVRQMLKNKSLKDTNVIAAGRGASNIVTGDSSEVSKSKNRRTELILTKSLYLGGIIR